jgi:hypothetical protein
MGNLSGDGEGVATGYEWKSDKYERKSKLRQHQALHASVPRGGMDSPGIA